MKNKKISEILIGSNNGGKIREIASLLPKNIKIYSTKYFKLSSPKETGKLFFKNLTSSILLQKTGKICIADDLA